jgi:hypothetical protein
MYMQRMAYCMLLATIFWPIASYGQQAVLVKFDKNFDVASVETHAAKIRLNGDRLHIDAAQKGGAAEIIMKPADGRWQLSQYHEVAIPVRNVGAHPVTIGCQAQSPDVGGSAHNVKASVALAPGERNVIRVKLTQALPPELRMHLVGMRSLPLGICFDIDANNVTQLKIRIAKPGEDCSVDIGSPRAWFLTEPNEAIQGDRLFPMIDGFGQFIHKEWRAKIHSAEELSARKVEEAEDLKLHPGPAGWDQYGGWKAGPQLKATGFFRTEKYNNKWWFVDPEGHLFWSMGINCVGDEGGSTPITYRERWFADVPKEQPPFDKFYRNWDGVSHGYYKDKRFQEFNFTAANLLRKYGDDWEKQFYELVHPRLRSWGINTIACMSDSKPIKMRKTPFAGMFGLDGRRLEGSDGGFWNKFVDVYDPAFPTLAEKSAADCAKSLKELGEEWCMGVFVENEMGWGDELSFGLGALRSPSYQAAKLAFIDELRTKYGSIDKLNATWGMQYESWAAMIGSKSTPSPDKAREDLETFCTHCSDRFFEICQMAFKKAMPNHLYLGCRFSRSNPLAVRSAAKYCDVVSFNRYQYTVADLRLPEGCDKPIIIGEFQFGATDRGMFNASLSATDDQSDRANTYKEYVESALDNPAIIGVHWFQFGDQACTGRGDEENYQIGFVDICDTPYPEIIEAARAVGNELYQRRNAP